MVGLVGWVVGWERKENVLVGVIGVGELKGMSLMVLEV